MTRGRTEYQKRWSIANTDKVRGYQLAYRERQKALGIMRKQRSYQSIDPRDRLFYAAKRRAKVQGLPFELEKEDIVVPETCPYLGIPLVRTRPRGSPRRDIASLDRIDPTKGYVKGNVEVMSWLANTMKNDAPPELLVRFAKEVLRRYAGGTGL